MGRITIPKYMLVFSNVWFDSVNKKLVEQRTELAWSGRATEKRLQEFMMQYGKSLQPGGVNDQLRDVNGCIPYPVSASIYLNGANRSKPVVSWKAPAFMVC